MGLDTTQYLVTNLEDDKSQVDLKHTPLYLCYRIISGPTSIGYRAIYTYFYQILIETKYKNSCYCKSFANRLRNFQNDKQNHAEKS